MFRCLELLAQLLEFNIYHFWHPPFKSINLQIHFLRGFYDDASQGVLVNFQLFILVLLFYSLSEDNFSFLCIMHRLKLFEKSLLKNTNLVQYFIFLSYFFLQEIYLAFLVVHMLRQHISCEALVKVLRDTGLDHHREIPDEKVTKLPGLGFIPVKPLDHSVPVLITFLNVFRVDPIIDF